MSEIMCNKKKLKRLALKQKSHSNVKSQPDVLINCVLIKRKEYLRTEVIVIIIFYRLPSVRTSCLRQLIDTMGRLSSEAQELSTVITTYSKFVAAPDQVKVIGQ